MAKKEKAKPCPFCGDESVVIINKSDYTTSEDPDHISMNCYNCNAEVHFAGKYSIDETIECWNKRKY